jgi:23S rRNA (cytidine1920-2'-O)/16S rRNA (cytidine1409-2'-O)-methyltransferase
LNVAGLDCLDVGASTGGFTDCLLQHGAARVIALDVGHGQIHPKIAADGRVTVIERFNARFLTPSDLPYAPQFAVADVSFISLRLIMPRMADVLPGGAGMVTLIKPQFEAGRKDAPRGVVRDPLVRQGVVDAIRAFGTADGRLTWIGVTVSPLTGPEGNVEFLAYWKRST